MSTTRPAHSFDISALPETMPVFPLPGVILLPRSRLPLHIFEPRYLAMIDDVLASRHRLIGMIQPTSEEPSGTDDTPPLYSVGCAGRITSFAETDDGRLLIGLSGVSRFGVAAELNTAAPYRQVQPVWQAYAGDLAVENGFALDRKRLAAALKPYTKSQNIEADWVAIDDMDDETAISTLAMICPFACSEKQALLEAANLSARADMLMTLLEMSALPVAEAVRH